MGAIEDFRQLAQDFLAPEMKALTQRVEALEKGVADADRRAEKRHEEVMSAIRQVIDFNSLSTRVALLEAEKQERRV